MVIFVLFVVCVCECLENAANLLLHTYLFYPVCLTSYVLVRTFDLALPVPANWHLHTEGFSKVLSFSPYIQFSCIVFTLQISFLLSQVGFSLDQMNVVL